MMLRAGLVIFLVCLQLSDAAKNVSERIYMTIDSKNGFSPCIRLTNANKQVGCSSPSGGAHGVMHLVNSSVDLAWVMTTGTHHPYVPLITQSFLATQPDMLTKFIGNSRIAGALIIMEKSSSLNGQSFSPDLKCPNQGFGLYSKDAQCNWNPAGSGLLLGDYDFPIYSLFPGTNLSTILDCTRKYNSFVNDAPPDYPLCATNMLDFMYAVKDTFTCMTQGLYGPIFGSSTRCDPLEGYNVWGTLTGRNASDTYSEREIILVVTRLDAKGLFKDVVPGAESSTAGMVALMAALRALAPEAAREEEWAKKIVYVIFNGESLDYIGSSRMVYDMKKTFPAQVPSGENIFAPATFNLSSVKTIIEVGQVGLSVVPDNLFLHYDNGSNSTEALRAILTQHGKDNSMNFTAGSGTLPPASSQMFLREDKRIEVAYIADHGSSFTNRFYNSYLDDAENLKVTENSTSSATITQLTRLSTVVARTLAQLAGANTTIQSSIAANAEYIRDLTVCFTMNFSCPLVKQSFTAGHTLPDYLVNSRYIGVNNGPNNYLVNAVQRLIAQSLGADNRTLNTSTSCQAPKGDSLNSYLLMRAGVNGTEERCVIAPVYTYFVQSPAFLDPVDYRSTVYSTWTESRWNDISMEIFLKPSPTSEHTALGVGITLVVVFIALTLQINRVSSSLFDTSVAHNT